MARELMQPGRPNCYRALGFEARKSQHPERAPRRLWSGRCRFLLASSWGEGLGFLAAWAQGWQFWSSFDTLSPNGVATLRPPAPSPNRPDTQIPAGFRRVSVREGARDHVKFGVWDWRMSAGVGGEEIRVQGLGFERPAYLK